MTPPSDDPTDWRRGRPLGQGGPVVTGLGLGCAPLGNLFTVVEEEAARATVDAAWDAGIRLFDVAPLYGHGVAEERLGRALSDRPRDEAVVSTKVGRVLEPAGDDRPPTVFRDLPELEPVFDFSGDGVRRSLEASLDRLGLDRIDVVLVHDPDDHEEQAMAEAFPALLSLRDQGVVRAVGAGMNQCPMLDRFVDRVDLDVVLVAGRYTLLDRSAAETLLPRCAEHGVGVMLGGVFNSGILADPDGAATYDYDAAPPELVDRARRLQRRCEAAGWSLPEAAVAFARNHGAVTTVLLGARTPDEVAVDVAYAARRFEPGLVD